jgi:5-methylcytosine-specific restriction endonuclease McrA
MPVLVLDKAKKPLMPCSERRARLLLERGRAVVHLRYPFAIRLKDVSRNNVELQPIRLKIDPGSKFTGLALVRENVKDNTDQTVLWLGELQHRGSLIRDALTSRRAMRRTRRNRNTRYRAPRFNNRTRSEGWLAPSLQHRVDTVMSWTHKLSTLSPIVAISQELVRFDMQKMENPEISGIKYQQGTLAGYEVREYLLEKWNRQCSYCDAKDVPLQVEHVDPRKNGGSDRISNLCLACEPCNMKKGTLPISVFLKNQPDRLAKILSNLKNPLRDAAAVNITRWALANALKATGLPVELASGGKTKFNRSQLSIPKSHSLDALCVGNITQAYNWNIPVLHIKCTGRGSYQRTRLTAYGFPRGYLMRKKSAFGFQTGDIVIANVTTGKKIGTHIGRVAIRATGSFNIQTQLGIVQGISHKHCHIIHRADGYGYLQQPKIAITGDCGTRAA